MGFWETGSLGLHPTGRQAPDKVGPWDGIKTTPQHAKKTLVAAGRMPVRGKENHRLGSKRQIEEEEEKKPLVRQASGIVRLSKCESHSNREKESQSTVGKKIRKKNILASNGNLRRRPSVLLLLMLLLAVTNQSPAHTPTHIRLSTLSDSLAHDAEFLDRARITELLILGGVSLSLVCVVYLPETGGVETSRRNCCNSNWKYSM